MVGFSPELGGFEGDLHLRLGKTIQFYLKHHHSDAGESEQLLENPAYQELLNPYFKPVSQELLDWANAPYEKNSSYHEQLIHKPHLEILSVQNPKQL